MTATLSQTIAANSGAFAEAVQSAIADWCKTATPQQIKEAFFPERAGVEIHTPDAEIIEEPNLKSYGEIFVIKVNSHESFNILWDSSSDGHIAPFVFHDKETARAMCDAHSIPYGNIVPANMWKLDNG